jgi:TonB family protein
MRTALLLIAALLTLQTQQSSPPPQAAPAKSASKACRTSKRVSPPDSKLYQFIPAKLDWTKLNRHPQVSFVIKEDGSVRDVKIVKGTGSPKADAGLVKSIEAWKYEPPQDCTVENRLTVIIDIA